MWKKVLRFFLESWLIKWKTNSETTEMDVEFLRYEFENGYSGVVIKNGKFWIILVGKVGEFW